MNGFCRLREILLYGAVLLPPLITGGTGYLPVTVIRLLILMLGFCWLWSTLRDGNISLLRTKLDLPVALLILLSLVSTLGISPYKNVSVQWFVNITSYALLLFVSPVILNTRAKAERLLYAVILGGILEASVGIWQFIGLDSERVRGTFFNTNFLAGYLAAVLVLTAGLTLHSEERKFTIISGVAVAILFAALLMTRSRGGILAVLAGLTLVLWRRYGARGLLGVMVVIMVVGVAVPNPLSERMEKLSETDIYAYSRMEIWSSSLKMMAENPWGTGLGIYKFAFLPYNFPVVEAVAHYGRQAESAHNIYLQAGVELGVAGFAIFIWGVWQLAGLLRESLRSTQGRLQNGMTAGLAGGICSILVHGIVDVNLHAPAIAILLVIMVSLMSILGPAVSSRRTWDLPFQPSRSHYALLCCTLVLLGIFIIKPVAAYQFYSQGQKFLRSGDAPAAEEAYKRAVFFDTGNAQYTEALSELYFRGHRASGDAGLAEKALGELRYAESLNPLNYRFPYHQGMIYLYLAQKELNSGKRGYQLAEALNCYTRAIMRHPYYPFSHNETGEVLVLQGKMEEATQAFKRAIEMEPNFLPARMHLAAAYQKMSMNAAAREEYLKILDIKKRFGKVRPVNDVERYYLGVDETVVRKQLAMLGK